MASGKKSDPPIKGILKSTSNFKKEKSDARRGSQMKWDEVNIKATFHPVDKTYGHQKVDEPPTPYHFNDDSDPKKQPMNPSELASKPSATIIYVHTALAHRLKDVEIKEHEKERRGSFEDHRKAHYNEYQAVKLARHLLEQEEKQHEEKKK